MLDKIEVKEKLDEVETLEFKFNYLPYINKDALSVIIDVKFGYNPDDLLIKKLSFKVNKEDKICIIGKNGKGKSTLLKLITGDLKPLEGTSELNNKATIGYFGQMNIDRLDPKLSIAEELQQYDSAIPITTIRRTCGNMMFSGDLAHKKIAVLSGGERSRVMLGKILLKPVNLLLLDEPTNHLDMESCDSLMTAIQNFEGAVVMVTHDEYFLKQIANKLIIFDDGKVFLFEGNYEDFLRRVGWKDEV